MRVLFLALSLVVTLAPAATLKGRPASADTVTVTLVRWPFT
jgi:hypothetical protein